MQILALTTARVCLNIQKKNLKVVMISKLWLANRCVGEDSFASSTLSINNITQGVHNTLLGIITSNEQRGIKYSIID